MSSNKIVLTKSYSYSVFSTKAIVSPTVKNRKTGTTVNGSISVHVVSRCRGRIKTLRFAGQHACRRIYIAAFKHARRLTIHWPWKGLFADKHQRTRRRSFQLSIFVTRIHFKSFRKYHSLRDIVSQFIPLRFYSFFCIIPFDHFILATVKINCTPISRKSIFVFNILPSALYAMKATYIQFMLDLFFSTSIFFTLLLV